MKTVWRWMSGLVSASGARKIKPDELRDRIGSDRPTLILDVRTPEEQVVSCIPKAILIHPGEDICLRKEVSTFVTQNSNNPDAIFVIYCASSYCSSKICASCSLEDFNDRVFYLDGGIIGWVNEGGSLIDPSTGEIVDTLYTGNMFLDPFLCPTAQQTKVQVCTSTEKCEAAHVPPKAAECEDPYLNR